MALDYKAPDFRKQFIAATPKYIDCVRLLFSSLDVARLTRALQIFENVGGEMLDMFLTRLNKGARIALCGSISQYNATSRPTGLQNYLTIISMRATLQGFIVFDYADRYREAAKKLAGWIGEGKIKRRETKVTGIEKCPEALEGLFKGANVGKMYIEVGHPDARL